MKELSADSLMVHFEGRVYSVTGRFDASSSHTSFFSRGVNSFNYFKVQRKKNIHPKSFPCSRAN